MLPCTTDGLLDWSYIIYNCSVELSKLSLYNTYWCKQKWIQAPSETQKQKWVHPSLLVGIFSLSAIGFRRCSSVELESSKHIYLYIYIFFKNEAKFWYTCLWTIAEFQWNLFTQYCKLIVLCIFMSGFMKTALISTL